MLPGKYYGHVVTQGANSWIRGKIEFSSYVNKALLNSVFGNFQRSLKANSYFTVSYIYLSNIFIKTWEKKRPLCRVRMCQRSKISGQVSTLAMVFGCSVSFSLMINCFSTTCLFSIGTYIRERIEKYAFMIKMVGWSRWS